MQQTNNLNLATKIKMNSGIEAPINDIIECIQDVKKTGISSSETIEKMVVNMFTSNKSQKYSNMKRVPKQDEILLYDCNDSWLDLVNNPE